MPKPLYHISQLPEYRNQVERQREVLTVATGFTPQDKADLTAIYDLLLAKADTILAKNVHVNQPQTL